LAHSVDPALSAGDERPSPGERWRHDAVRVIVTGVSRNVVTFSEDGSGGAGSTREALAIFLEVFHRTRRSGEALRP
jgi:hypothetical protein